jgi:hypothetical protein
VEEDAMSDLPAGWEASDLSSKEVTFSNQEHGLNIDITTVSSRRRNRKPLHYRIQIRKDWFAEGLLNDDYQLSAKRNSWEEARTFAQEFMKEFGAERAEQPTDEVEAMHRSVKDSDTAEGLLDTSAAAEAFADVEGYSDELLLEVIETVIDDRYLLVANRDGDTINRIATAESEFDTSTLRKIHATFPVDKEAIEAILSVDSQLTLTVAFGDYLIYRFIAAPNIETNVVIQRGTKVTSPTFEMSVWNVIEER